MKAPSLEVLAPDDFYKDSHKNILNAMIELDKATNPIDILTVFEYLKSNDHMLEDVGGKQLPYIFNRNSTYDCEYYILL